MTENNVQFTLLSGTVLLVILCFSFVVILFFQKRKQNKFHQIQEESEVLHQNQLLETQTQVQEESMKMIAREIHDNAVQDLVVLQTQLTILKGQISSLKENQLFSEIEEQTEQIKDELRNISHALHNEQIKKYGLFEMMRRELFQIQQVEPFVVEMNIEDTDLRMPDMTEILIFRIFQEAVHNTIKYANATKLMVNFNCKNDNCILEVMDNGCGFDMDEIMKDSGIGINNMSIRAKVLQSELSIITKPEQGCHLTLKVPKHMYVTG